MKMLNGKWGLLQHKNYYTLIACKPPPIKAHTRTKEKGTTISYMYVKNGVCCENRISETSK